VTASTLETIIDRAVRLSGQGWGGSLTAAATGSVTDSAAKATSLGTDAMKGAWIFRPDAANASDYVRRLSSFTVATGVFTHDGPDYTDTTFTSESYMIVSLWPPMTTVWESFSWQLAVNLTLAKLQMVVRDGSSMGTGGEGGKSLFSLTNLSGVTEERQIRNVYRRYAAGTSDLSITLAEPLDSSETGVDVSDGAAVEVDEVIRIDDEDMLVTAISSNTLTVVRGYFGTTAATHSSGAAMERVNYTERDTSKHLGRWKFRSNLDSGGVIAYALDVYPAVGENEQLVVEYLKPFSSLSTPSSTTECPLDLVARGTIYEAYKAAVGRSQAYLGQMQQAEVEWLKELNTWKPKVKLRYT